MDTGTVPVRLDLSTTHASEISHNTLTTTGHNNRPSQETFMRSPERRKSVPATGDPPPLRIQLNGGEPATAGKEHNGVNRKPAATADKRAERVRHRGRALQISNRFPPPPDVGFAHFFGSAFFTNPPHTTQPDKSS